VSSTGSTLIDGKRREAAVDPQIIISVLSLIVAVTGAVLAYVYFQKSRKYKELAYEIAPTLSLVSIGPQIRDRVEIKYKHGNGETEDLAIEDLKAESPGSAP
jgi:hypothetical protein